MNPDDLSYTEVAALINEIKEFLNHPVFNTPTTGKYKCEDVLTDKVNGIIYKLSIYRGNIESKYSMHIRFTSNNEHLVRLCIHGSKHHNDDRTIVSGSHIHIYKNHDGQYIEAYAYSLEKTPFNEADDLAESMEKFFQFVHVKGV